MTSIYFWPESPLASLFAIWALSMIFLWAARSAMLQLVRGLGEGLADGLASIERRCAGAAEELHQNSRDVLLAAGTRDAQARLDHELHRIDVGSRHIRINI